MYSIITFQIIEKCFSILEPKMVFSKHRHLVTLVNLKKSQHWVKEPMAKCLRWEKVNYIMLQRWKPHIVERCVLKTPILGYKQAWWSGICCEKNPNQESNKRRLYEGKVCHRFSYDCSDVPPTSVWFSYCMSYHVFF